MGVALVPVVAIGAFVVFGAGYLLTWGLLVVGERLYMRTQKPKKVVVLLSGETEKEPRRLTERAKENLARAGGVASIALVVLLMVLVPRWAVWIWLGLMGLGYLGAFVVWMLQLSQRPRSRR